MEYNDKVSRAIWLLEKEPPTMTKEEINKALGERVMGWFESPTKLYWWKDSEEGTAETGFCTEKSDGSVYPLWNPAERIDHAWMVEDRIKDLGLEYQYCRALIKVCNLDDISWQSQWALIHATPEQRCLAALEAKEER